jgi:predicted PurR-regulated permease PerM
MPESSVRRVTWRNSDVARVLAMGTLFLFLWQFFWMVINALFLAMIAVLLAIVLHEPARYLSRWIPFRIAFALVVVLFLTGVAAVLIAVVPQIVEQVGVLARELPAAMQQLSIWVEERTGTGDGDSAVAQRISEQMGEFIGRFVPLAFNLIAAIFGSFAILILAIFLAAQPHVYRDLLFRLAPPANRERWMRVYDVAGRGLRNWVIGKSIVMVLVGFFTWLGLTLFGIPAALALGALAAVLEFIPNLGPTIAAAPAIVAAFLISPATALYVAMYYFVLQQIQSALTVPLVEQRAVHIPPAVLLIWQLMLAVGFGIVALFVATPLLSVIVVAMRILYFEPAEERKEWDRRETAAPDQAPVPVEGDASLSDLAGSETPEAP